MEYFYTADLILLPSLGFRNEKLDDEINNSSKASALDHLLPLFSVWERFNGRLVIGQLPICPASERTLAAI